jgi:hypothetical protein
VIFPWGLAAFGAAIIVATGAGASTCVGVCGTSGPDGVVTSSPYSSTYKYVTTRGGASGAGTIPQSAGGYAGTNGSVFTSDPFTATAGAQLKFYFDYVTSDGSGFADYAWSELQTSTGSHVAWLFTAATQPSGNTSPGQGLPADDSTLTPSSSGIIGGPPIWSPLGGSTGTCYKAGCGYTGWIQSDYNIAAGGNYQIAFGVTNAVDTAYDSGLAFNGLQVAGLAVGGIGDGGGVPEPATWALLIEVVPIFRTVWRLG